LNKIENGYSLNNRNVSLFKMFHVIWAIIFIIKLYKSLRMLQIYSNRMTNLIQKESI